MNKVIKSICTVLVLLLGFSSVCVPSEHVKADNTVKESSSQQFEVVSVGVIENDRFRVEAEGDSGAFSFTDKENGTVWHSNPANRAELTDIKGIAKMQMNSQLIVDYLVKDKNTKQSTSFASCTNKKGIKVSTDKKGIRIEYNFVSEKFTIPLLLTIDKNGLVATVLCDEIKETGDNKVTNISLLPYFGAAGAEEDGYFLVPDGSGAVINFNNGKSSGSYQQEIYDTDGLMNVKTNKIVSEKARLPVFGIEKGNDTLLSVIEGGATVCRLYAYVSGNGAVYNYIYPQFTFRQSAVVGMLSKTWYPVDITFISPLTAEENFSMRYMPVAEKNGGYSDMSCAYREYLLDNGSLEKRIKDSKVPLYLDIYGSALVSENVLGIPLTVNRALTSFDDAQMLLETLKEDSVDSISVRYLGMSSSGLDNKKVPTSFKPASSLGGKKGFNELVKYADKNDISVYPDYDFVNFTKPTFSLIKQLDAAKDVCNKTGVFYEFDMSNGNVKNGSKNRYALKPFKVEKATDKFFDSFEKKTESRKVSLSTLGNFIYSDFDKDISLAEKTSQTFVEIMNELCKKDYSLMLESPNAYALGVADAIISAPSGSSDFDIADYSVPFYQMVLHGIVSYSVEPINLSIDSNESVLKAIETGSSLMYSLSDADYSVISYDDYDHLYSITANNWLKDISENYKKVQSALEDVADNAIIKHEIISEHVTRTVYDNGVSVIVNYTDSPAYVDGKTIAAEDYLVIKEAA